ncbi:MAG: hypothetical protein II453_15990, partial [Alphaproteobacteria bacterium]|nr:hypothetical protein [Alphaproteobacteria bacterium]
KLSSAIAYGITIERMRHNDNKTKYAMQSQDIIDTSDIVSDTLLGYTNTPTSTNTVEAAPEGSLLLPAPEGLDAKVDAVNDFKEKMLAAASRSGEYGSEGEAYAIEKEALEELVSRVSNEDLERPVTITKNYFRDDQDEYTIPQTVRYNGKTYKFYAEQTKNRSENPEFPEYGIRPAYNKGKYVYGFYGDAVFNTDDIIDNIAKKVKERWERAGDGYSMHSGGAAGADTAWGENAAKYGIAVNHYYGEGNKTPAGNKELSQAELDAAKQHVLQANKTLKRNISKLDKKTLGLLERNYKQVSSSDAVFAIGMLKGDQVDGGTGWAVQMAIDNDKPVYVFDQNQQKWLYSDKDTKSFGSLDVAPRLTQNFAGIGTREINTAGKKAINDVFIQTFGSDESYITNGLINVEMMKVLGAVKERYSAVTATERQGTIGNKLARDVVAKVYSALEGTGNIIYGATTYDTRIPLRAFIDGRLDYLWKKTRDADDMAVIEVLDSEEKPTKPREEAKKYKLNKKDRTSRVAAVASTEERDKLLEKYIADVYKNKRIKNKEQVLQLLKDVYREDYASWEAYRDTVKRSVENIEKWARSLTEQNEIQSRAIGSTAEAEQAVTNIIAEETQGQIDRVRPHAKRVDFVEGKESKLNAEKESIEALRTDPLTQALVSNILKKMGVLRSYYGKEGNVSWSPTSTAERNVETAKTNTSASTVTEYKYEDEEGNEKTEQVAKDVQDIAMPALEAATYGFQDDELDVALRITGTKRENFDKVEVPATAVTQVEYFDAYVQAAKAKIIARAKEIFPVTKSKNQGLNTQASLAEFRKAPENQLYEIGVLRDAGMAARKAFADRFATTTDALIEKSRDNIVVEAQNAEKAIGFVEDLPIVKMLPISKYEKKMMMVRLPSDELQLIKEGSVIKMYYGEEWISGVVT